MSYNFAILHQSSYFTRTNVKYSKSVLSVYHVGGGGLGVGYRTDYFHTSISGKNEIEKTIIQKRNENENENTFKNDK